MPTLALRLPPQPQLDWQDVKPIKKKKKKGNWHSASLNSYSIRGVPASAAVKERARTQKSGVNRE